MLVGRGGCDLCGGRQACRSTNKEAEGETLTSFLHERSIITSAEAALRLLLIYVLIFSATEDCSKIESIFSGVVTSFPAAQNLTN